MITRVPLQAEEGAALLGTVAAADSVLDDQVTLFIPTDKAFGDAGTADLTNEQLIEVHRLRSTLDARCVGFHRACRATAQRLSRTMIRPH